MSSLEYAAFSVGLDHFLYQDGLRGLKERFTDLSASLGLKAPSGVPAIVESMFDGFQSIEGIWDSDIEVSPKVTIACLGHKRGNLHCIKSLRYEALRQLAALSLSLDSNRFVLFPDHVGHCKKQPLDLALGGNSVESMVALSGASWIPVSIASADGAVEQVAGELVRSISFRGDLLYDVTIGAL